MESKITKIAKVALKSGHAEITMAEEVPGRVDFSRETVSTNDLVPHPDLLNAMDVMRFHALRVLMREHYDQMSKEDIYADPRANMEFNRINIRTVFESGQGAVRGITIVATQDSFDGNKTKITTGKVRIDPDTSSYRFAEELLADWENIVAEAELYVKGEKFVQSSADQDPELPFGEKEGVAEEMLQ